MVSTCFKNIQGKMYTETTRICGSIAPHIEGIPMEFRHFAIVLTMVNPYTGMPDLDLSDLSPYIRTDEHRRSVGLFLGNTERRSAKKTLRLGWKPMVELKTDGKIVFLYRTNG